MIKYSIFWSPLAEKTYLDTVSFIFEKWTVKEAEAFVDKVESLPTKLITHKNLCPPSGKQKQLRRCVISPQTSLVYQNEKNIIELVAFVDNRSKHQY